MSNLQIRDPEQKHVICRKLMQSSISGKRDEDVPKTPRSRDSRKNKGAQIEDLSNGKLETNVDKAPNSKNNIVFKKRPGFGQLGSKCIVKANFFLADLSKSQLCHYSVKITPEVSSSKLNKAIMAELLKLYKEAELGSRLPVYDGKMNLYTAGLLPFTSKEFAVTLLRKFQEKYEYKVKIEFIGCARVHQLKELLAGKHVKAPQETLTIIDTVLRELALKRYSSVGRLFYSPEIQSPHQLGEGVQSWRGFYQSIRPTQMGLALNLDMSASAFIEPLPIVDFVSQLVGADVRSRPLSDLDSVKVKKVLSSVKVEVMHRGNLRRKYRVSGLSTRPTGEIVFPLDEEMNMISLADYFREMYGFAIHHTHLPCLHVGSQQKTNYMPMEACKIVQGQRYTKRLTERQIASLLKATCKRPCEQEADIMKTVQRNNYNQDPLAKEFGISISDKMATVEARVLPPPLLKYNDAGKEKEHLPQLGQWNMKDKKVVNGCKIKYWACINFSNKVEDSIADVYCQKLVKACQESGMEVEPEPVIPLHSAIPEKVEKALRYVYNAASIKLEGKELELVIAILPDHNGRLYGDLKRICETELGLISQCCLTKFVLKPSRHYLANLALKINVKMGGRNTVLMDALNLRIPMVSDIPTIIFGADVTHPDSGEDLSPSIAAVVASQDWPEVTKYAGLVSAQAHREEIIQDLFKATEDPQKGSVDGGMIRELMLSFKKATGRKPLRIIFYRDGVSDGQFHHVLLYELNAIRQACASLEPGYQPTVTFVIVQKRNHARLFPNNHDDKSGTDKSGNVLPGTVVDTKICHPTDFDFYLCSHAGIQGTSRPAHYHVLWDENNFSADEIQSLTNNLCYTYARCTRSVSVVPPAYYAHLAAYRARFYLDSDGSDSSESDQTPGKLRTLPELKDKMKNLMFYC